MVRCAGGATAGGARACCTNKGLLEHAMSPGEDLRYSLSAQWALPGYFVPGRCLGSARNHES